jgi:sorting nexin-29
VVSSLESLLQTIYIQSDNYWKRVNTYYMFVDFKAAYDSVDRAGLFKAMEEFHVLRRLRCLAELTLKCARCRVKTVSGVTESFETKKGFREGDTLACLLFNLALEKII